MEIATLTREDGKTKIKVLKQKEVEELIKRHEAEEAKAEKDKKEKEQKEKDKWVNLFPFSSHHIVYCFVFYIKSLESVGFVCDSYHKVEQTLPKIDSTAKDGNHVK